MLFSTNSLTKCYNLLIIMSKPTDLRMVIMKKAIKASTMQLYRIIATTILMLILTIALIVSTVSSNSSHQVSDARAELIINLNRFMDGSAYLTSEVRAYAATGLQIHSENYWNEVEVLKNRDIGVENMQAIGITAEEDATIRAMQSLSNELIPLESAAMDLVSSGNQEAAIDSVFGPEYESTLNEIAALQTKLTEMIDTRTAQSVVDVYLQNNIIYIVLFIIIALILVIQAASEFVLKKRVITPINKCSNALHEISKGDFTYELDVPSDTSEIGILASSTRDTIANLSAIVDELSCALTQMSNGDFTYKWKSEHLFVGDYKTLSTAYRQIATVLPNTLKQLQNASSHVRSGSEQLSNSAQSLAQCSSEQASTVKELNVTIADITGKIKKTASDSISSKEANAKAQKALHDTMDHMSEMMLAMEEISAKSQEIGKIIKAIDDIAFQTNILSLNASVEAARAGMAGKGFAVVAEEVGNLATKSAKSAKDTTALVEDTLEALEKGNRVAKNTSQSINVILEAATKLSKCVNDIAEATEEQTDSANEMSQEVSQISAVVVTNSATAEQTAAISEELLSEAHKLRDLIATFKFKDN